MSRETKHALFGSLQFMWESTKSMTQSDFSTALYWFVQRIPEAEQDKAEKGLCFLCRRCYRCKCKKQSEMDTSLYCDYCGIYVTGSMGGEFK